MRRKAGGILLFGLMAFGLSGRAARCGGEDPVRRGLELLRAGKAVQALDLLEKGVKDLRARKGGEEPPAELLYDLGLAALRAGRPERARAAFLEALAGAEKKGGLRALAGWGLGSALWRLGQAAEKAGPAGWEKALDLYGRAREAWVRALLDRPAWKALARNIERANRKIRELKKRKQEQKKKQKKQDERDQKKKEKKKDENRKENPKGKRDRKKKEEKKPRPKEKKRKDEEEGRKKGVRKKKENPQKRKNSGKPRKEKPQGGKKKEKPLMSPEQWKKLVDMLKRLEAERIRLEKARVPARPKGGKGW